MIFEENVSIRYKETGIDVALSQPLSPWEPDIDSLHHQTLYKAFDKVQLIISSGVSKK